MYGRGVTMLTQEDIIAQLKEVNYPGFSRSIISFGVVKKVDVTEDKITVSILLKSQDPKVEEQIRNDVESHLKKKNSAHSIVVEVQKNEDLKQKVNVSQPGYLEGVKYKIAVASGKGGVGKSTVAVNLAVALAKQGLKVGLLDADIYGPSIPLMLGIDEQPGFDGQKLIPIEKYGVQLMSLGFLVDSSDAVIWRGALVTRALQQLMGDVKWEDLDVILFDMPPGTGDAQLTLSQSVALDGAIIVSTPQDVALADAVKGVQMFRKVNVPILGIVENMSYFICGDCGGRHEIFDHGGAQRACNDMDTELLGEIPLDGAIRVGGDKGKPIVAEDETNPQAQAFVDIAKKVVEKLQ